MKYQILTYNQISAHGLHRFPSARYLVGKTADHPDAIVLRSHDLRTTPIPASVKAIGRAGSGTNNIPVAEMSEVNPEWEKSFGPNRTRRRRL